VDFPYRLYQLLCWQQVTAPVPYPAGRFNRNLIGDIWQMRLRASQLAKHPAQLAGALLSWLAGFGRVLMLREKQDGLVLDDPQPGWAEIAQFVRQRMPQPPTPDHVTGKDSAALAKLIASNPQRIMFLCQGNICRSPYAAYSARSIFNSSGLNIAIDSAGMLPRNARPSPPQALAAAQATHIDLTPHLSQCADAALVAAADVILIFDDINYTSFKQRHPTQVHKLLFLSAFASGDAAHQCIADPDGKDVATFMRTYTAIDSCLHNLVQRLKSC
jgi:protein-tyrosine-phosphatase